MRRSWSTSPRANHWAKADKGKTVTYTLIASHLRVRLNGGTTGFSAGERVKLVGKLAVLATTCSATGAPGTPRSARSLFTPPPGSTPHNQHRRPRGGMRIPPPLILGAIGADRPLPLGCSVVRVEFAHPVIQTLERHVERTLQPAPTTERQQQDVKRGQRVSVDGHLDPAPPF